MGVGPWSPGGAVDPAVGASGAANEATHGADGIREVEEGIDDVDPAFVATCESMEGVLPGVGALYVSAPCGLAGSFLALVCDPASQSAFVEGGSGLARVVAGVQVHGEVVGQPAQAVQTVQGRGEQRRVVAVRSGQDAAGGEGRSKAPAGR